MSTHPTMPARKTAWNKLNRKAGLYSFAATCAMGVILLGVMAVPPAAQGQTLTTLYSFTGAGGGPSAGLVRDTAGNLYGTTTYGGNPNCALGCGTVFKLDPIGKETLLHSFTGGT